MVDLIEALGVTEKVTWDMQHYKEYDTQGTGHELEAKLAPSKWKAALVLHDLYNDVARRVAAAVRKNDGKSFMVYDPSNPYPASDPKGLIIAGANVLVSGIGGDNQSLSFKGLPAGYKLTMGDKAQIVFASGERNYFFELSADVTASGLGVTTVIGVWPPIPVGVAVDAAVVLARPSCKMKVIGQGFAPGQSSGNMTFGTSISLMEKI
jgi:hypothetical protein